MSDQYDQQFLSYAEASSSLSARIITQFLQPLLTPSSVLDVGCARGTWLQAWQQVGVTKVLGIDGDYVDRNTLQIAPSNFKALDLSKPVTLEQTFDLVQSLEVGEHLPTAASEEFVRTLTQHSRGLVLFSAALPGQGGEFHLNEQPFSFWRHLFAQHDFVPYDSLRPHLERQTQVSFWYRFNTMLYVHRDAERDLPAQISSTRIPDHLSIPDVSPPVFRARKLIVRTLPAGLQNSLARLKARFWRSGRF